MYILLFTICLRFLSVLLPYLLGKALALLSVESTEEAILRRREADIRRELAQISMVDEFAKYAKLQRQLNKIQDDLKASASARTASYLKNKVVVSYCVRLLIALVLVITVWMQKYTPVIILPSKWLYPIDSWLSWPTGVEGGISISAWLFFLEGTTQSIKSLVSSVGR